MAGSPLGGSPGLERVEGRGGERIEDRPGFGPALAVRGGALGPFPYDVAVVAADGDDGGAG
eukprot:9484454-Pyramimonas_sp.AAC.1